MLTQLSWAIRHSIENQFVFSSQYKFAQPGLGRQSVRSHASYKCTSAIQNETLQLLARGLPIKTFVYCYTSFPNNSFCWNVHSSLPLGLNNETSGEGFRGVGDVNPRLGLLLRPHGARVQAAGQTARVSPRQLCREGECRLPDHMLPVS